MRSNSRERSVACHSFVWFQLMWKKSCFVVRIEKSVSQENEELTPPGLCGAKSKAANEIFLLEHRHFSASCFGCQC